MKAYDVIIYPIPNSALWPDLNFNKIIPEKTKKKERKKKARRKGEDGPKNKSCINRVGWVIKCSNCKRTWHNATGCKYEHVPNLVRVPAMRGRPRKNPIAQDVATAQGWGARGRRRDVSRAQMKAERRVERSNGAADEGGSGSDRGMRGNMIDVGERTGQYLENVILLILEQGNESQLVERWLRIKVLELSNL